MTSDQFTYLDHAATTPLDPRVLEAMLPYFSQHYGNPSSIYSIARDSRRALDASRERVAAAIGGRPNEIIFTGCGSEADNLALRGVALARREKGNHLITSAIEHHAILHTCEDLEKRFGFEVTYLPVDEFGRVDPQAVEQALTDRTVLVSIMMANNEVGTVQPIAEIGAMLRERKVPFHTDAVQAGGSLPIDVDKLNVDLLSLSAHKFYGPKGVGVLYARRDVPFLPQITGGGQERSRRAGTENLAGIVGMATALELAVAEMEKSTAHASRMRDILINGVLEQAPNSHLTGHPHLRLPNSASFVFDFVEGESILLNLDILGIAASSGSACTSGSLEPSHVLRSMGVPVELAHGSLRLTTGASNTEEQMRRVVQVLPPILEKLRMMSPLTVPAQRSTA